jgi:hypothetical protein
MKEDFSDCRILDEVLTFYTYTEFCSRCNYIKYKYKKLNSNQKMFYHYYIYANQHMTQTYKDRIKDFLNDDCSQADLENIIKFYKPRNIKNPKIKK